jgi:hypothetical protein
VDWLNALRGATLAPLNVDQFTPMSATFEVRYGTAFLIWDQTGSVWEEVKKRYPGITVEQAAPNQVRVKVDDKRKP